MAPLALKDVTLSAEAAAPLDLTISAAMNLSSSDFKVVTQGSNPGPGPLNLSSSCSGSGSLQAEVKEDEKPPDISESQPKSPTKLFLSSIGKGITKSFVKKTKNK